VVQFPCKKTDYTVFGPTNCTLSNVHKFVTYVSCTCFDLYKAIIREAYTTAYKYSKIFFFLFCGLCVVIYPYNTNQQDALFALNLFRKLISTCFEQAYCSSSWGTCLCICSVYIYSGDRCSAVVKVLCLQIGRSLVRSHLVSLEPFIDIILPIALWPWGRISL